MAGNRAHGEGLPDLAAAYASDDSEDYKDAICNPSSRESAEVPHKQCVCLLLPGDVFHCPCYHLQAMHVAWQA